MDPLAPRRAFGMLLIGSASRNAGKTLLASRLLAAIAPARAVNAFKVTMLRPEEPVCARRADGCPGCATHADAFCLAEETEPAGSKDTQRLLAAGAHRVFWLRVRPPHLAAGAEALLAALGNEMPSIGESNRLRTCVEPDLFLMVRRPGAETKDSAAAVLAYADCLIDSDGRTFGLDLARLQLTGRGWRLLAGPPAARPPFEVAE